MMSPDVTLAASPPRATAIVLRRATADGYRYPIVHRTVGGPDYHGLWAWAPPTGVRHNGEAVLPATLRSLAEITGLRDIHIDPIDLGRSQSLWLATIDETTPLRLGDGFDRCEWLDAQAAMRRCHPRTVAATIAAAENVPGVRMEFRPLAESDLPTIVEWSSYEHLSAPGTEPPTLEAVTNAYTSVLAADSTVRMHILVVDGRPCGMAQLSVVGDSKALVSAVGHRNAVFVNFTIADPKLHGRGLGPQFIWSFLRQVALPANPEAGRVHAAVSPKDGAAFRVLQKAGFDRGATIDVSPNNPEVICTLDVFHWFGAHPRPTTYNDLSAGEIA